VYQLVQLVTFLRFFFACVTPLAQIKKVNCETSDVNL